MVMISDDHDDHGRFIGGRKKSGSGGQQSRCGRNLQHLLPLPDVASTSNAAANVGKFQQFKLISNRLHNYAGAAVRRVSGRTLKRVDLVSIWSRLTILMAIV